MKGLFIQYNSPVVLTFGAVSLFALLLGQWTDHASTWAVFSVYRSSFTDPLAYVRILLHVLGHANFEHFFSNFLIILLVGPMLEERHGGKNILLLIAFTALITGLVQIIFFDTALLGASGIVFMFMILAGFANLQKGRIPLTLILVVVIFIGREFIGSITIDDQISRITHIVGGLCGAVFGIIINKQSLFK
ncbi:MAG: rhomboid family intramembrane serine protease [Defluviitaleaceae bacterium]|nr:rhomboid family intramembrane serine protease [Defluviitaleaceae bacterium]